jgi:uncharacterized protein
VAQKPHSAVCAVDDSESAMAQKRWPARALVTRFALYVARTLPIRETTDSDIELNKVHVNLSDVLLSLDRLHEAFDGYRIVHISDLHMGDWMNRARLEYYVQIINAQQPDLIAITGDFVTSNAESSADDLVSALKGLRSRDGTVAILGNHDHWSDARIIRMVLAACGIQDLSNSVYSLARGEALLHFAGVDDVWEHKARLDIVLNKLPASGAAILLAHEPDFADVTARTGRFDLQLSGHSHGGQVVMPFVGPLLLPPYARKYPAGCYRVGTLLQYTNRGLGMLRPHVRINCPPEITMLTLKASRPYH